MGKEKNSTTVRSLYYPLEHHDTRHGQLYCSEHSDYGSITLLFQDSTGGLQILGKDGEYHDVPRVPDAVLLNIGDLMQRWTADKYPSTKHRVVVAQDALERRQDRQSIAFFVQPDNDALITCLDGSNKYPPITSFDYLMQRYGVTY
nr:hypothetical protein BaRGS_004732 [Batillaria attramentaria]